MLVAKLKLIRMKYGISCAELGAACEVSPQRICQLESNRSMNAETADKLCRGMEIVLRQRQDWVDSLRADLKKHGHTLMDFVEETRYEL